MEELGFTSVHAIARMKFLIWRGNAHAQWEPNTSSSRGGEIASQELHIAAAATCFRDAGSLALVMNDIPQARDLWNRAGQYAVQIGAVSGYLLMDLGQKKRIMLGGIKDQMIFKNWRLAYSSLLPRKARWSLLGEHRPSGLAPKKYFGSISPYFYILSGHKNLPEPFACCLIRGAGHQSGGMGFR